MNRGLFASIGLLLSSATATAAHAGIVYSNNFDTENNGASAKQYTGFSGLTVSYPSVDLVHTGDGNGVVCSGGCVDLDGGTSGQLISDTYAYTVGQKLTLTFSVSGSQRASSPVDDAYYAMRFDQPTGGHFSFVSTSGLTYSDDLGAFQNYFDPSTYDVGIPTEAAYDFPFADVTFSFTPTNSGTFRFLFDGYYPFASNLDDDAGRIIDNVALDISAVPEPSTWAMAILGFGLIGAAARYRRPAARIGLRAKTV